MRGSRISATVYLILQFFVFRLSTSFNGLINDSLTYYFDSFSINKGVTSIALTFTESVKSLISNYHKGIRVEDTNIEFYYWEIIPKFKAAVLLTIGVSSLQSSSKH